MSEFQQVVKEGAGEVFGWTKRIFLGLLVLALVGGAIYVWVGGWTYSEGTRSGYLIKISKKGTVLKTYEGQLNLGGFQSDPQAGVMGNIWEFSVAKNDIYEQLQQYQGQQVTLSYRERYITFPWQGDTHYFVYKVDLIRPK